MYSYLLALEITPLEIGKTYTSLPLHCTLVPWFSLDMQSKDCLKAIRSFLKGASPVQLIAGQQKTFTAKTAHGIIPLTVNTIKLSVDLRELHLHICEKLDTLGARYATPQYVKEGFTPHVTHQGDEKLVASEVHCSEALYLIAADTPEYGTSRRVISKIKLTS
jgi:hypothetical protein